MYPIAKGFNMNGVLGLLDDAKGSGRELAEAMLRELKLKSVQEMEAVPYAALAAAYNKLAPDLRKAGKYMGCAPKAILPVFSQIMADLSGAAQH